MNVERRSKPLSGWRVLVPRGGKWGDDVAASLRTHGAIPVIAPMINFASTENPGGTVGCAAPAGLRTFDWLVVTSATTVDVLVSQQVAVPAAPASRRSAKPPARR